MGSTYTARLRHLDYGAQLAKMALHLHVEFLVADDKDNVDYRADMSHIT